MTEQTEPTTPSDPTENLVAMTGGVVHVVGILVTMLIDKGFLTPGEIHEKFLEEQDRVAATDAGLYAGLWLGTVLSLIEARPDGAHLRRTPS